MIWKDGEQEVRMFLEALNNYHPLIKFTHTMDKMKLPFWIQQYTDDPQIEFTPGSTTNKQIRNYY